jgi:hypothetical protein
VRICFYNALMNKELCSAAIELLRRLGIPASDWADELKAIADNFPIVLPEKAPELYAERTHRKKSDPNYENIEGFLRRVWKTPWIDAGVLTMPDLERLDPQAYTALHNWLRKNKLPPDLHIPTKNEIVEARFKEQYGDEGPKMLEMIRRAARDRSRHRRDLAKLNDSTIG